MRIPGSLMSKDKQGATGSQEHTHTHIAVWLRHLHKKRLSDRAPRYSKQTCMLSPPHLMEVSVTVQRQIFTNIDHSTNVTQAAKIKTSELGSLEVGTQVHIL